MGSGFGKTPVKSKSVKLHRKGQKYVGIVVEDPVQRQATVYGGAPGELATWADGQPKMQWHMTFLTISEDICDCEDFCAEGAKNKDRGTSDDDGVRKFYVPTSGNLITAMVDALKAGGAPVDKDGDPEIETGGVFAIQRTGLDYEKAKAGNKPPVLYGAAYKPPTPETLLKVKEYETAHPTQKVVAPVHTETDIAALRGMLEDEGTIAASPKMSLGQMKQSTSPEED